MWIDLVGHARLNDGMHPWALFSSLVLWHCALGLVTAADPEFAETQRVDSGDRRVRLTSVEYPQSGVCWTTPFLREINH